MGKCWWEQHACLEHLLRESIIGLGWIPLACLPRECDVLLRAVNSLRLALTACMAWHGRLRCLSGGVHEGPRGVPDFWQHCGEPACCLSFKPLLVLW